MNYNNEQTLYDVLGVSYDADYLSIENSRNRLKFGNLDERAPISKWDKIDEAFDILTDPIKREAYDKQINFNKNTYNAIGEITKIIPEKVSLDYTKDNNSFENKKNSMETSIFDSYNQTLNDKLSNKDTKVIFSTFLEYSVLGPFGLIGAGVFSSVLVKEKLSKAKLKKDTYTKVIIDIKTEDSRSIFETNQKLLQNIKMLLQHTNNFKFQMAMLKYKNQIELLKQIIDMRNQTKKKFGTFINLELNKYALELEYFRANRDLQDIKALNNRDLNKLTEFEN